MGYKKDMSKYENLEGWERCGFGEQLDRWAEKYGERTAVTDSEDEISYMELKQKADCLAAAFLRKGILKGDKVLVQLPNRISFVIVFFALSKIGAVPIMMLPAHREAELEGIIELAKPAAYIVVEKYLGFSYVPMANAMKEKYSCIRHIFIDSESGDISGMIAETCGENGAFPAVDGYETAVLLLSGGTTGVPKLIPRTHTDYMYNARMSAKRCRLDSSDVYLASLPVAHNFPLCCPGLLGTLDVGGKVVLASATSPDDILDAITEEGVTITALVPAMVTVCMEMLEWDEDYDISSLRILQVGGAMLEDSLADKIIEEWPCKLMQVFGTAEGLLSFTSPEDEGSLIARCQGTPVSPADEVKIVDEEDKAVPEGVFGEEEVNIPSGVTIGNVMLPSVKETFEQIWPDAVKKALEILFKQNRTEKMSMAQYQIYVSKLWSEICQKVGYMNIVDYDNFGDIKSIFYDLEKRHLIKKENDGIE